MIKTTDIIREYGCAMRLNWGVVDGRSEKQALTEFADKLDKLGSPAKVTFNQAIDLRSTLGLCPYGGGCWDDCWTDDETCPRCDVYERWCQLT